MAANRWGTFNGYVASWCVEFAAEYWRNRSDLEAFADTVVELGRRTEVFRVGRRRTGSGLDLFGDLAASTLVCVFGPAGIEQRWTRDLGGELLERRPELGRVPRVPALSIDGPVTHDRAGPVYISISTATDLWFPRVVGIHEAPVDGGFRWLDNSALADRHTPRLNAFLAGVRDAAAALGGGWSSEAGGNWRYADWIDESGIRLDPPTFVELLERWSVRICTAPTTDAEDFAGELDVLELTMTPQIGGFVIAAPPAGLRELRVIERDGRFARLEMQLGATTLNRADLDAAFGVGVGAACVPADSFHTLTYRCDRFGSRYGCEVIAEFALAPTAHTPVAGLSLHRRSR